MGTTSDFLKLRSSGAVTPGAWNSNYAQALSLAKKNRRLIVACWSNGDACGYCTAAEKCMMTKTFTDWMKGSGAYFVFQYSGDPDQGKTVHDWCYGKTGLKYYPGFRISLYDKSGKLAFDHVVDGNTLRGKKTGETGAKNMVANLKAIFAKKPADKDEDPAPSPASWYAVRLNERLTVAKINKVLDAIDKNGGYCPCQPKSAGTKCHCEDFRVNKGFGEPCICNIYVKQKPVVAQKK